MKSLKEILENPRFQELKVLTKKANLKVPVVSVDISETPDIAHFIQPNSLLLTTGMVFQNDEDGLCQLIKNLKALPCAGIAIKLDRYIPKISEAVLDYADDLDFVIMQVPNSMTLSEISHKVLSYLWDNQTEEVFFSLEVQQKFASLLFKGASLSTLIDQLSTMIKQPILLLDPFGQIAAQSQFQAKNLALTPEKKDAFLKKLMACQREASIETFVFNINETKPIFVSVLPIQSETYLPYLLVILETEQLTYPFSKFVIEQSLMVLALAIYKEQGSKKERRLIHLNLFQNLLQSPQNLNFSDLYPSLQTDSSNYYRVVLARLHLNKKQLFFAEKINTYVYDFIENSLTEQASTMLLLPTDLPNQFALLFRKNTNFKEQLMLIQTQLHQLIQIDIAFAIGDPVNQLSLCHFSYQEALSLVQEMSTKNDFIFYNKIKSINRIAENVSKEEMIYFCESILKNLAYPKTPTDLELRRTLMCYLDSQCKIVETAEKLFLHRNTVKYRIEKCHTLFGTAVDSPELSLQLRVALYLSEPSQKK